MTDYKALEALVTTKVKEAVHDAVTSLEDHEPTVDTVVSAAFDSAGFPPEIGSAAASLITILISFMANKEGTKVATATAITTVKTISAEPPTNTFPAVPASIPAVPGPTVSDERPPYSV